MKKSFTTSPIHHLFSNFKRDCPSLGRRLTQQEDITRFKNTFLTPLEREQILFIVPKNNQLLFAFKHKALCVEFNHYKHKVIIESLKAHIEHFPSLGHIDKIHAYVPTHILQAPLIKARADMKSMRFYEHSHGIFTNHATDKKLHAQIEALRECILRIINTREA